MSSEPPDTPPRSDLEEARVCLGIAQTFLDEIEDRLRDRGYDAPLLESLNDTRAELTQAQDHLKRLSTNP